MLVCYFMHTQARYIERYFQAILRYVIGGYFCYCVMVPGTGTQVQVPTYPGTQIPSSTPALCTGYLGTWVPGYLGTWVPGYLGTWVPGYHNAITKITVITVL